jgi:hypothetical protein
LKNKVSILKEIFLEMNVFIMTTLQNVPKNLKKNKIPKLDEELEEQSEVNQKSPKIVSQKNQKFIQIQ